MEQARQRWERQGLHDYDYTLHRSCFCYPVGAFSVAVRADTVYAVLSQETGEVLRRDHAAFFETIEGLFELVERAEAEADGVDVAFDERMGYPERIQIDWIREAVDDELGLQVQGVVPFEASLLPAWLMPVLEALAGPPPADPPRAVSRWRYRDQTVYYVPPLGADAYSDLYDAEGTLLCHPDGGFTGGGDGQCPDFFEQRSEGRVVWRGPEAG